MYMRIQNAFCMPEGVSNFWDFFEGTVVEFRKATENLDRTKLLALVTDPTKNPEKA